MLTAHAVFARGIWLAAIAVGMTACGTSPSSLPPLLTTGGAGSPVCERGASCPTEGEYCIVYGDLECKDLICAKSRWTCAPDGGEQPEGGITSDASDRADEDDSGDAGGMLDAVGLDAVEGSAIVSEGGSG